MKLEVISEAPRGPARPTPLLFVHGAYSSAAIWKPFFLPYFAGRGYAAHAVSLRAHGASERGPRAASVRLRDFVEDVIEVARTLPTPPVLIGHSMGGMVAQHAMHGIEVAAVVLLASGPPHGTFPGAINMALGDPALFRQMTLMQNLGPEASDLAGARRALFRDDTPLDYIRKVLPPAYPESHRVVLDMLALDLPPTQAPAGLPIQVVGGGRDPFVTLQALRQTARTYKTEAHEFDDMPHAMMLERGWEAVAQSIADWLDRTLAKPRGRAAG